jgi:predicted N-acyltransferase
MKVIRDVDRQKWSDFIYRHPQGNIFQSPEMYDVYKKTDKYEPLCLAVINDRNDILGILVSVIQKEYGGLIAKFTTRAVVWGGPLVKDNNLQILELILHEHNKAIQKKAIFTQFRNMWDCSGYIDVFTDHGYEYSEHLNFIVDLSVGKDRLLKNLSASKRRQIRKTREKENISIVTTKDKNDVIEFYSILSSYYTQFVKKPLPPLDFFLNIMKLLVEKDLAKIFVVKYNSEIIGGIVCPISTNFLKRTIYELYVCGSRKYNNLYPSIMATWAPIEWGAENEIDIFDFMGAGKPGVDYGVREFKAKFGGHLVNYGRFEKIHQQLKFHIASFAFKIWQMF